MQVRAYDDLEVLVCSKELYSGKTTKGSSVVLDVIWLLFCDNPLIMYYLVK